MDVEERLSLEAASGSTSQACEHLHRYEFAASLCEGLRVLDLACGSGYGAAIMAERAASVHGVDRDVATIDLAAATYAVPTFEAADAVDYLEGELAERYEMIVCFEGIEHLSDLSRVTQHLHRHASKGMQLVISVPNSATFEEDNPYHLTDFSFDSASQLLEQLGGGVMLCQYLSEGSIIGHVAAEDVESTVLHGERAEPRYANHFLLLVNVDSERIEGAQGNRSVVVEAPVHNRYMHSLEVANGQLRRRNNELARKLMRAGSVRAKVGSAATALVASLEKRIEERERRIDELEGLIEQRDEMILAQRGELLQVRQELVSKKANSRG
jgi:cyclopropane fatty-acyl-phospholipid synthase-like methyltransferase